MYGGGAQSYKPDKKIGKAAMEQAEIGRDYLSWTKDRAKTTDAWAAADRARSIKTFRPLEDKFIRDAQIHDSAGRLRQAAQEARADVMAGARVAREGESREMAAMGIDPRGGRYRSIRRASSMATGLAAAGASNLARNRVRSEGVALRGDAVNMGRGLAVNPLSSFAAGSSGVASGTSAAQGGLQSQAQILQGQDNAKLTAQNNAAQANGAMFEGLGTLAGFALMSSDENVKEDRKEARSATAALRKIPIDSWKYKDDAPHADGGTPHTGAMAQDFQKATGTGDGKTINVVDAIGVTMKAVKEIDAKVSQISRGIPKRKKAA